MTKNIVSENEIAEILQRADKEPLVIIASRVEKRALETAVLNRVRNNFPVCVLESYFLEKFVLNDIANICNTDIYLNFKNKFGSCKFIKILKDKTIFIFDTKSEFEDKTKKLSLEITKTRDQNEIDKIIKRRSFFQNSYAEIFLNGDTELEFKEKREKFLEILEILKLFNIGGISNGGGVEYLKCAKFLEHFLKKENLSEADKVAYKIFSEVLKVPLRQILINSGQNTELIIEKIFKSSKNLGYNVLKSKFVDLNNEGILDPTIFLKKSLINAVKVVSMLINTACMIA